MDTLTLIRQHGWRAAVILGVAAFAVNSMWMKWSEETETSFSSSVAFGYYAYNITITVVSIIWLASELAFAVRRGKHFPPGSLGFFGVGNTVAFFRDPTGNVMTMKQKFGNFYTEYILGGLAIVVGKPADVAWLWQMERKGRALKKWPPHIAKLLGPGCIGAQNGGRHSMLVRVLRSGFTATAVRSYTNALDSLVQQNLKTWAGTFQSTTAFKLLAMKMFCAAAFGPTTLKDEQDKLQELHDHFEAFLKGFAFPITLPIPGTPYTKAWAAKERIVEIVKHFIRKFHQQYPPDSEEGKRTLFGRILHANEESGKPMDVEDLTQQITLFIFAGGDTTRSSLGTVLYYLSKYPAIAVSLTKEVMGFQDPLDFDELKNAPILNAFLAECLRMDPPNGFGGRVSTEPLELNGYKICPGTQFFYNVRLATQNEDIYPNPTEFCLDRFLPSGHPMVANPTLHAKGVDYNSQKAEYPVFGGGPHSCIASQFAKLQLRVFLTRILRGYDLQVRNSKLVPTPVRGWKSEFKLTAIHQG